jgi:hypothetical protein
MVPEESGSLRWAKKGGGTMAEPDKGRLFGRSRRKNVTGARQKFYSVYVTPDEQVQLEARAAVREVTVPRLLFESAMVADVETDTDRKAAIMEMFEVRRLLASVANNANQLARFANTEGSFPVEAESIITEYRAIVPRLSAAIEKLADS